MHRIRHCRREEQRLRSFAEPLDDLLDLGTKSHVEHAVGLVQNQEADALQPCTAALLQIDQPPGSGDDHLVTPLERVELGAVRDPAVDHRRPDLRAPGECTGIFAHLLRQLPGRAEHEDLKSRSGVDHLQRRQHEGPGLAGAGPGDPHYVRPGHDAGNGPALNGSRRCPSRSFDGGQAQFREPEG